MRKFRTSYLVAVMIAFALNGWALMQLLSIVPRHDGFIAAALLVNMVSLPIVLWVAFVYGEVAAGLNLRHRRSRPVTSS
jgi:ABC-type transporter Mla maintaining outer membrane lipid asymmetry permease subunit MlaE